MSYPVCSVLPIVSEVELSDSPVLVTDANGEMSTCPVFQGLSDCELSALSFFVWELMYELSADPLLFMPIIMNCQPNLS